MLSNYSSNNATISTNSNTSLPSTSTSLIHHDSHSEQNLTATEFSRSVETNAMGVAFNNLGKEIRAFVNWVGSYLPTISGVNAPADQLVTDAQDEDPFYIRRRLDNHTFTSFNLHSALINAAQYNRSENVNVLLTHSSSEKINDHSLGKALIKASKQGHVRVVEKLLSHEAGQRISHIDVLDAIGTAVTKDNINVMLCLLNHFGDELLPAELGSLLTLTKRIDTLNALLEHPLRKKIPAKSFGYALNKAVRSVNQEVVELLLTQNEITLKHKIVAYERALQSLGNGRLAMTILDHVDMSKEQKSFSHHYKKIDGIQNTRRELHKAVHTSEASQVEDLLKQSGKEIMSSATKCKALIKAILIKNKGAQWPKDNARIVELLFNDLTNDEISSAGRARLLRVAVASIKADENLVQGVLKKFFRGKKHGREIGEALIWARTPEIVNTLLNHNAGRIPAELAGQALMDAAEFGEEAIFKALITHPIGKRISEKDKDMALILATDYASKNGRGSGLAPTSSLLIQRRELEKFNRLSKQVEAVSVCEPQPTLLFAHPDSKQCPRRSARLAAKQEDKALQGNRKQKLVR